MCAADPRAVRIRTLRTSEWRTYRDARLRALQSSPDAFATTYAEACQWSEETWQSRLRGVRADTDLPLCAEVDGVVVGIVWVRIADVSRQTAHVHQMWVDSLHRGRGIGRSLLEAGLAWAREHGARRAVLDVTFGNAAALRLYSAAGFTAIGEPEPLRRGSSRLAQTMTLTLGPEDT